MTMPTMLPRRREAPPPVFRGICQEWLKLSSRQTDQFWQALSASQWTRPREMRSAIQCRAAFAHNLKALEHLVKHNLDPKEMIAVIEELITERVLAPKVGRLIESCVLDRTTREGRWK
jgi:hypothetical protein